jgi:hypothetical protein
MSFDFPRWGRRISPADEYARELIYEVHDFIATCKPELKPQAQQLIDQIRFNEITLAQAETALAHLEDKNINQEENEE